MRRPLDLNIAFSVFGTAIANCRLSSAAAALSALSWSFANSYKMRSMSPGVANWAVSEHDGNGGKGVTLSPAEGGYNNVVIWLHGLGDTADGWADAMPQLKVPKTKFILPTANSIPINLNGNHRMPGWSDIFGLSPDSPEDKPGLEKSRERIDSIVAKEVIAGISPSRIILAGFSQGGALALHTALRSSYSLGGCIGLSTWLPLRSEYPAALSPAAASLRVFQAHGNADSVVHYRWGHSTHEFLKEMIRSPEPQFMTIERMGHLSHPDEMDAVEKFINSVFKADPREPVDSNADMYQI